jgi:penicillin-binding protein 1B
MRLRIGRRWKINIRKKVLLMLLGTALAGLVILSASYIHFLFVIVTERFEGERWDLPSKIYSDSLILYPGQDITGIRLIDRLTRLDYRPVSMHPERPGEYHLSPDRLEIFLHDFLYPDLDVKGSLVHFELDHEKIVKIIDPQMTSERVLVELEPELIAAIYYETWEERVLVRLDEVPPHLVNAILAVEDARFYQHIGIDPRSTARALWVNLKRGAIVQGGSTLTQQLVKNFYLNQEKTLTRKLNEALMALLLEMRYSKEEILEAYLNEIYMGQSGTMGIYGVGEAARFYFGKKPRNLTVGESALLAGVIKSPNLFSPFHHPEKAIARKVHVLNRVRKLEMISDDQYRDALHEKIPLQPPVGQQREAPYFVDFVRQQLLDDYPPEVLVSEGFRIFTTLDMQLQHQAEETLLRGLKQLETRYPSLYRDDQANPLQGSLVVLQPQTGHIKAMVGGRDYSVSQFNRATQAHRQPGSLFKLFVYAAAISQETPPYTAATLIDDSPFTWASTEGSWTPENYDKTYHGPVTLRTALEKSLNVATVKLAQDVGLDRVVDTAHALGIRSPLNPVPSLALGTSEVIPLDIAVAYATIANGGMRTVPLAVKEVVDQTNRVLKRRTLEMDQVLTAQEAYLLTHLLEGVVDEGTGRGVRNLGVSRPVAGKTGTSSDYRDAWFAGFTPELLALVWVGFDQDVLDHQRNSKETSKVDQEKAPLTGASAAVPIWADFIKQATAGLPPSDFVVPPGILFIKINPRTGLISTIRCPDGIDEAFIKGTQPTETCIPSNGFTRGVLKWLRNLLSAR